jgi:hypothetical protein
MVIWNKVLVGLIAFTSLIFFYMAARTLKTHQVWSKLADQYEARIKQVDQNNLALRDSSTRPGDQTPSGIRQLKIELADLLHDRGRAWSDCKPKIKTGREDGTAEVILTIDQPSPNGIAKGTILYAFDENTADKKGAYLGEFKVTQTDEKKNSVVLVPTGHLNQREVESIAAAQRSWRLYEIMPSDTASPVNYLVQLKDARVKETLLTDQIIGDLLDNRLLAEALAGGKQQEEAAKNEVARTKQEVAEAHRESGAVRSLYDSLEQKLGAMQNAIERFLKENKAMAGQIAAIQLEAARQIDARTRAMARSDAGGP